LHLGAVGDKDIDLLSGFIVRFFERRYEKGHGEAYEWVEPAKPWVGFVLPIM